MADGSKERNAGLNEPATIRQREKGYDIFTNMDVGRGASHIEKIDSMDIFESDDEAARYAEQVDGVRIIHDIQFEPGSQHYANYIDTPENRDILCDIIWENALGKLSVLYGNQIELPIILNEIAKVLRQVGVELTDDSIMRMGKQEFEHLIDNKRSSKSQKKKWNFHYDVVDMTCKNGDVLRNTNGNDYRIMEKYSDKNMLFMDVDTGALIVGVGVSFVRKLPKATEGEIEQAKGLINDYCLQEYDVEETFEEYPMVILAIARETIEKVDGTRDNIEIVTKADLENYKLITTVDDEVVDIEYYECMEDFIKDRLEYLEYDELVSLSEDARLIAEGRKEFKNICNGINIEWGHGRYLTNVLSDIDFAELRREFSDEPKPNEKGEYSIEIREVLSRTETVKAEYLSDAIDEVVERYKKGEIVLSSDDFKGVDWIPVDKKR